ncbi:hypothetical protein GCM10009111_25860 [Colwellia asteriadis]|uniref:Transmembrane protein n=1 Tax=Colwellia asteriadis TaxID=517723 RepID=A0ABN1L9P0_9GAMM
MIINTNSQTIKAYESTAYKGKANSYYRENIAGPKARKRHLAKAQCQLEVFPRVKITGICWDNNQDVNQFKYNEVYEKLNIADNELRLPLDSLSQNFKEGFFRMWRYLHLIAIVMVLSWGLLGFIFLGWKSIVNDTDVLVIGFLSLQLSRCLYLWLEKLNIVPAGQYVIFNRRTGMVEIAKDDRSGYHHLPFEQFNAHHRTVHNERGHPTYGFTLLHYKLDLMYQVVQFSSAPFVLAHWELIKNFMNTEVPLADIPQFERYRQYDPTTIAHDKKHKRPLGFWKRVDKKFINKVKNISEDKFCEYPINDVISLHEALQLGYKVPDICYYPWREATFIADKPIEFKPNWFLRYVCYPMIM